MCCAVASGNVGTEVRVLSVMAMACVGRVGAPFIL